jgi:hypothetical protein
MNAVEFGEKYQSCEAAMIWRRSLPEGTTQAEAYLRCKRGKWTFWQLMRLKEWRELRPQLRQVLEKAVARALRHSMSFGGRQAWRVWAQGWLRGERSAAPVFSDGLPEKFFIPKELTVHLAFLETPDWETLVNLGTRILNGAARLRGFGTPAARREQRQQAKDFREVFPEWRGE